MNEVKSKKQGVLERLFWSIFIPPPPDPHGRTYFERLSALLPHINLKRPVPMDVLRVILQLFWLILVKHEPDKPSEKIKPQTKHSAHILKTSFTSIRTRLSRKFTSATQTSKNLNEMAAHSLWDHPLVYLGSLVGCLLIITLSIMTPFDILSQAIFVFLLWLITMMIRHIPGHLVTTVLVVFSFTASSRYLWWRWDSTLNWNDPLDLTFGLCLLIAEVYIWFVLLLGYFQSAWPLEREPRDLPDDLLEWPTIDVFIPTYNEPLSVVKPTVYAAMAMDWPKDKINVYVLDDGCRSEFHEFARSAGAHYLERKESTHAKAGNLNLALTKTNGEFVAIFDCDHIPTRSFLQTSMGLFLKDKKLAVVQTPHHFFSADPFEKNLNTFGKVPNENELFYGLIQDGNDLWNATFFCGSCAVIKRGPLLEIGGIAVETVTEDAHTALRLHRLGYNSAFLTQKQAAGLATESLSGHIGQRIRWARGMTQIFRIDNPLLGKGLKISQRLCYVNGMLHFLNGIPRLIFLTSPLAFLLFKAYIIYASAMALFIYVLPHLLLSILTNSRVQGKYRHTFWSEIYETALAWHIAKPTTVALIAPGKGTFNVTEKGGVVDKEYFDWSISKSYLILVFLNLLGFGFGIHHLLYGDPLEFQTVIITMLWTLYNIMILGTVVAVTTETKQVRQSHRIKCDLDVTLFFKNGHCYRAKAADFSEGGLGLTIPNIGNIQQGDTLHVSLKQNSREFVFPVEVSHIGDNYLGVHYTELTKQQEEDLIRCTFSRADAWIPPVDKKKRIDRPLYNMFQICLISLKGYTLLVKHIFRKLKIFDKVVTRVIEYFIWLLPRNPKTVRREKI